VLHVGGCIVSDKWISVEGWVYECIVAPLDARSTIYYETSSLSTGCAVRPVEGAYLMIYEGNDLETRVQEAPDSQRVLARSDVNGHIDRTVAAPSGEYEIGIQVGKSGYQIASIIVDDPPDDANETHDILVLLVRE
jgi:hypothetical protein